ncbi:hypothetical protein EUGRSUZ_L01839 [Eucalyptus grandis]|uniref:Uncharacterized protein n=1 Tax=Eucalyptus grandis TaxID=71139 RepID=A0A058ZTF4_EUCGR|nr:hypothetical protein EUGRSUZ_L01839 [Eucalyptus grandis]
MWRVVYTLLDLWSFYFIVVRRNERAFVSVSKLWLNHDHGACTSDFVVLSLFGFCQIMLNRNSISKERLSCTYFTVTFLTTSQDGSIIAQPTKLKSRIVLSDTNQKHNQNKDTCHREDQKPSKACSLGTF